MKTIFLSIATALTLISAAFANKPYGNNERARISFQKEFKQASDVKWAETNNYIQATFQLGKETLFAYYDYQGNLVGLVQNLLTTAIPEHLQADIQKHYSNYWVTELFQVSNEQGDYYYIELKNADETLVLTTDGSYSWHRYNMPRK